MAPSLSESLEFTPNRTTLEFVLDELEALGSAGGGAVSNDGRRAALATCGAFAVEPYPRGWRHDYAALRFDGLQWSTGRASVPALPRHVPVALPGDGDLPAIALENAGGVVHLGSTYLEPQAHLGDERVTLRSLSDAARFAPAAVAAIHGRIVPPAADRFVALSTAFQNCGAYVDVPDGVVLDALLQIVWMAPAGVPSAVFAHTVIRVGAGARASIVERHVGEGESFVAGVVEIDLAPGAQLDYVVAQEADEGARILVRRAARCAAGSAIRFHLADLGGALVRSAVDAQLVGPGAVADVNALFFSRGFGHVDVLVDCAHRASATRSQTIVRRAATDRGQGRFFGGITVDPGTSHCDASMRDDALVLSRDAFLEAVPALHISAPNVSASHAASVGSLDEEQLFYVQSRGIARGRAERMIALAFFEPAIERFPTGALRDEIRTALDARLDEIPETFAS